eukprot:8538440-Pyramimonas_sp.AAC.1
MLPRVLQEGETPCGVQRAFDIILRYQGSTPAGIVTTQVVPRGYHLNHLARIQEEASQEAAEGYPEKF